MESTVEKWEPAYGFCAYNETERVALAMTLEALRRRVCAYGGGNKCDCKYGLTVEPDLEIPLYNWFGADPVDKGVAVRHHDGTLRHAGIGSEATGCPELREMIHRLLHRDVPLF